MPSYSQEEIRIALALYDEEKNVTRVVRKLGYPTTATLYLWLRQSYPKSLNAVSKLSKTGERINPYSYKERKVLSVELKMKILERCFKQGEDVRLVAEEVGVSRQVIHKWRRQVEMNGIVSLMNKGKKKIIYESVNQKDSSLSQDSEEITLLKKEVKSFRLELDVLKEALSLIKKDKGIEYLRLKNYEKVKIINALKESYQLKVLFQKLNIAKSSYHYHLRKLKTPYKYEKLSHQIKETYKRNRCVYGYRRIKICLDNQGIIVSEKVIQRIMKEMNLLPRIKKTRKYRSYQGEITEAPTNIINRNFKSEYPNQKWLTDITEFALSNDKVYLSSIIDCFDGKIVSWKADTAPNADLANQTLLDACKQLKGIKALTLHSDRGCHYRWSEWISITERNNIIRSMSKKGCTGDNAACEGVFGHIKNECFIGRDFRSMDSTQFIDYLDKYLYWYNQERIKLKFGCSIDQNRRKLGY